LTCKWFDDKGEDIFTVAAVLLKNASLGSTGDSACLSVSLLTKYFISTADAVPG